MVRRFAVVKAAVCAVALAGMVLFTGCGDKNPGGGGGNKDKAYLIMFDANGGTVVPTSDTTGAGGKLASLPTPQYDGHDFDGWFTAKTDGTEVDTGTVFKKDTTIYAHWTKQNIIVGNSDLSGTISISPNTDVTIGTELTAVYSGSETVAYRWEKDGDSVGANSDKYTPTEAGNYTVTVSAAGYNPKTSAIVNVSDPSLSTLTGTITISPDTDVKTGTELTATYSGDETVNFQWEKDGSNIDGANSDKYTPTEAGSYIVTVSAEGYNPKTSAIVDVSDPSPSTFTDERDGTVYKKVTIGEQTWMAENLNYDAGVNGGDNGRCYKYSADSCAKYGRLYNWSTAMGGTVSSSANPSGIQGVCPAGWHLPSDAEWTQLTDFVGDESTAGKKLKSTSGWNDDRYGSGTDDYGFSALPGGAFSIGLFTGSGDIGTWWSATEYELNADNAFVRWLDEDMLNVDRIKILELSVRCVQD